MKHCVRVYWMTALVLLVPVFSGCRPAVTPKTAPAPRVEVATQVVSQRPVLTLGKEIEAPSQVNIVPWQPSEECVALANEYVAKMTVAQKAGQMAQVAMRYLQEKTDLATYHIGSMLAGGSDFPPGKDPLAANWAAYIDEMKAEAMKSELKIPLIFGIDAVHGNGKSQDAVVFPHNIGLGCTGDEALVAEAGRITALEALGSGVDWAFSPVLAAARDERWGRTYEAFGETPELAARYGAAMVRGIQGDRLGGTDESALACAKHFAGDGATTYGTSHMEAAVLDRGNTELSDAEFWRVAVSQYIPAIEAGVGSIMVSYSSVNGRKMHGERNLLTNILKGTLGFNGFVISDWKGIDDIEGNFTTDVETAVNAGIDMVMIPDRYKEFIEVIDAAVPSRIPQERVDDAARRILTVKCEMGLFKENYSPRTDETLLANVGSPAHRQVARRAVAKSLVLLKNEQDLLPLKKDTEVHVAGSGADNLDKQCGGWTVTWMGAGSRAEGTTVLDAVTQVVGKQNVSHSKDAGKVPEDTQVGIVVVGEYPYAEWRGDSEHLVLDDEDQQAVANMKKANIPFVVILFSGRPMIVNEQLESADAFVAAWLPGTEGDGMTDVLFGDAPFSGTLSHSWPKEVSQLPLNQGDSEYDPLFPLGFGLTTAPVGK
ncbi:MAG: glycoside hydrolase family 3 C-terminal domain-containing protein [Deltaproteobacteria bacterium]|nr:glycoside hydrolase family 3 C-terminal domain-containing protein [Deltaproteobacteria bacterium]MBN2670730.1 glycoside hydrolase family 3 C-terminal domain-containing protein [Deltaproteobacteria bacterium]